MSFLPYHPHPECPDEREPGVLLLDGDDECKTTAEPCDGYWRIVDWEVHYFDGAPCWFARSWYTISDRFIDALVRAQGGIP